MQRINETVGGNIAEVYQPILQEVGNDLELEYIYHTNRFEVLKGVAVNNRSKSKDILLAQNHLRAIKFVRRMASLSDYNTSEADIKNIHFTISE
jgi:hypothetical protein